jgi:hypothetical protein
LTPVTSFKKKLNLSFFSILEPQSLQKRTRTHGNYQIPPEDQENEEKTHLIGDYAGEEAVGVGEQHGVDPPRGHPPARLRHRRGLRYSERLGQPQLLHRPLSPI